MYSRVQYGAVRYSTSLFLKLGILVHSLTIKSRVGTIQMYTNNENETFYTDNEAWFV